jgi:YVTN family beta-propeller protein
MFKQLKWKLFSFFSSKVEDQTQAVAQALQNRAKKVERHAEKMEKLTEKAEAEHSDQVDQLGARAAWYRAKANRLHRRRTFLILHGEWRRITAWDQIQEEKKAGKYPTFCSDSICSGETYVVLEVLWRFLKAETQIVGSFAYVAQLNSISVIDVDSRVVIDTIQVMNIGKKWKYSPHVIVISPDGSRVYGTYQRNTSILVIDTDINRVIATIPVNGSPSGIAVTPDGTRVYAVMESYSQKEADIQTVIVVIATDSHTVIATIETRMKSRPEGVAISPDGKKIYVISEEYDSGDGVVSVIATGSHQVTATIPLKKSPRAIAITPNGIRAYVTQIDRGEGKGIVSVIDTRIQQVIATISVEGYPEEIAITPNGAKVYVPLGERKVVAVIDINSNTVIDVIKGEESEEEGLLKGSHRVVAITRDGTQAYMTDSCSSNVFIYSLSNHKLIDTIKIVMDSGIYSYNTVAIG